MFSRVYPQLVNGQPLNLSFNVTTRVFAFEFELNVTSWKQAQLSTEIFVPGHIYNKETSLVGFEVSVEPSVFFDWTYDQDVSLIYVQLKSSYILKIQQQEEVEEEEDGGVGFLSSSFFHRCKVTIHPSSKKD